MTANDSARPDKSDSQFYEALEREKLAALAEFAAGAGHEINNPLTVIAGRAELLLKEETDPERRRSLALIAAQAMRVYEMIADMMLFARPPRPEFQAVELVALVDGLIAELAPAVERHETPIRRTGDPGPIHLEADPTQLSVALRALCHNALEAIGHGGQVEIEIRDPGADGHGERQAEPGRISEPGRVGPEGTGRHAPARTSFTDCVTICVRDDGPGITPEERQHIFDPFYSARQAGRGLGLGLSKCWRIVTKHGGRIEVASQPGRGAAFAIVLPVQQG